MELFGQSPGDHRPPTGIGDVGALREVEHALGARGRVALLAWPKLDAEVPQRELSQVVCPGRRLHDIGSESGVEERTVHG